MDVIPIGPLLNSSTLLILLTEETPIKKKKQKKEKSKRRNVKWKEKKMGKATFFELENSVYL
jgi:hypothetical protein